MSDSLSLFPRAQPEVNLCAVGLVTKKLILIVKKIKVNTNTIK